MAFYLIVRIMPDDEPTDRRVLTFDRDFLHPEGAVDCMESFQKMAGVVSLVEAVFTGPDVIGFERLCIAHRQSGMTDEMGTSLHELIDPQSVPMTQEFAGFYVEGIAAAEEAHRNRAQG